MEPNDAPRHDHDQRLKELLKSFFDEFLELFFAPWHARLDGAAVRWLPQDAFLSPPQGRRRVIDIVGEVPVRGGDIGAEPMTVVVLV